MPNYLLPAELKTVGVDAVLTMITDADATIIPIIINETEDVFRSYMGGLYNVDVIFAKTLLQRSNILLKYMKDIIVYEVYIRKTKEINEVARLRYEDAMKWLDKVSKGQITLNLPFAGGGDLDGDGMADGEFFFNNGKKNYPSNF